MNYIYYERLNDLVWKHYFNIVKPELYNKLFDVDVTTHDRFSTDWITTPKDDLMAWFDTIGFDGVEYFHKFNPRYNNPTVLIGFKESNHAMQFKLRFL